MSDPSNSPGTEALDVSSWLTVDKAAEALKVNRRTVERMAEHHKIARGFRARDIGKPEPVYSPEDVETIAARRRPSVTIPRNSDNSDSRTTRVGIVGDDQNAQVRNNVDEGLRAAIAQLAAALAPLVSRSIGTRAPVLTREQAAAETGLSLPYIKKATRDGSLPSFRDGNYIKVHRSDLAALARQAVNRPAKNRPAKIENRPAEPQEDQWQQRKALSAPPPNNPEPSPVNGKNAGTTELWERSMRQADDGVPS